MNKVENERLFEFDLIRAVCTVGIIINHFSAAVENTVLRKLFYTFFNSGVSVGYTLVTVFFILSGTVLYNKYSRLDSVRQFYYQRWKSIFPTYYFVYISVLITLFLFRPNMFKEKPLISLLWTVIGMDGYVSSSFTTWYLVGEWFLGAIIILYVLFPILCSVFNRSEFVTLLIFTGLFVFFIDWRMLDQNEFRNVFSCIISFVIGFSIIKNRIFEKDIVAILVILFGIVAIVFFNNMGSNLSAHIAGVLVFAILHACGRYIKAKGNWTIIKKIVGLVSGCSYEIFLIHHVIISFTVKMLHLSDKPLCLLCPIIMLDIIGTVFIGQIIHCIMKRVVRLMPASIL
ncbi:MAG: acyltransferase family protein [Lachnospiraceae bacterium]|nr:acyltransferase family protein [Lachnospiraceae bacterium]